MYTIRYQADWDSDGLVIPIVEEVTSNDCCGDYIGIDKDSNSLWVGNHFYVSDLDNDDKELEEFLKSNFKQYSSVRGLIRRMLS